MEREGAVFSSSQRDISERPPRTLLGIPLVRRSPYDEIMPVTPHPDNQSAILVDGLMHRYQKAARLALDGLSFEVRRGEIVGLLGPNGAGKTTTIHAVLGLLEPTAGRVLVLGSSPLTQRHLVLPRINFASADVDLPSNLAVGECLMIFAKLYHVPNQRACIEALIEQFSLGQLRKQLVGTLSSGEQMRLKICKALLNAPELLVLDEPTQSLDPYMAKTVREALRTIQRQQGLAILHTSHNMQEVESFCDRIVFLHQGKLLAEGPPREVVQRFRSGTLEELFIRVSEGGELIDVR